MIIYFLSKSPFLKFLSSIISNFSCCLTSTFNLLSNSAITSFVFSKSSFLSYILCFIINFFHLNQVFLLFFFYLKFFQLSILWLLLLLLLLSFAPLLVLYIALLDWLLWYALDKNNFYFLFLLFSDFIGILFSFSFSFLLDKEEAHDTEVTWHVTWCDVIGLEDGGRI